MHTENISYEKDSNGIVTLTWDMPGRSMNVLSAASMRDFRALIEGVVKDDSVKGVVITSGKPAFMAGADLDELGSGGGGGAQSSEERLRAQFEAGFGFNKLLRDLETCGKPVAAAINGTALGGGLEVTLACHYRVVADDPKIQLGLPESKVGVMPGGGGTQRLPRLIGMANALPLMLQGASLSPEKALKSGIVHKVAPADQIVAEAKRWIREEGDAEQPWDKKGFRVPGGGPYDDPNTFVIGNALLRKQSYGNYPAQINIMKAVYEGIQVPIDAGLRIESRYFVDLLNRPESRNMIRTLFLSSQALSKGARRPREIDRTECAKVGILGAGLMGAGIAYVSAMAGIEAVLLDVSRANAEKGKAYSDRLLTKSIERGRIDGNRKAAVLDLIQPTDSFDDLKGCDLIIEAVFEDRGVKADVTKKAQAAVGADVIFGSNTSTLPITSLAQAAGKPENFIGIHFFSPVERMPLVEIIMGEKTGPQALAVAIDYVGKIRKTPIVVNDSRGFYTSRCFGAYVNEGLTMIAEGVNPALVENAGRMAGMPMGPMEVADSVGLDTAHKVRKQTKADLGDKAPDSPAGGLTEWMVEKHNRVGRKAGEGFYEYGKDGKPVRIWPPVYNYANRPHAEPDVEEVKKRLLYIQALETARCFEEGVLEDVRDADVGSIFGWGFAPYTGGTLSLIDTVGLKRFVEDCERMAREYGERFRPNPLLNDMAAKGETFYGRFNPKKVEAA